MGAEESSLGFLPLPIRADAAEVGPTDHLVQFYDDDAFLLDVVTGFISTGFARDESSLVIATNAHREGIEERLGARGIDLAKARECGQYRSIDAAEALAALMRHGLLDDARFTDFVGSLLTNVRRGSVKRVRVYGELVNLLWDSGNREIALRVEEMWNALGRSREFALLCGYPMESFARAKDLEPFDDICSAHSRVFPSEGYASLRMPDQQRRVIVHLQQRALSLEAEIAERTEIAGALQRREQELTDFLENAAEGLHRVGPDGTILWANKAELNLLGYASDEYVGHHVAEFHVDPEAIARILLQVAGGETLRDHPARLRCKDGSVKDVLLHANGLWEDGQFVHMRCFTHDMTALRRIERERADLLAREQAARVRAEEVNLAKDEFLVMLAHELRTPLTPIVTALELLQSARISREVALKATAAIDRQARNLTRLIDDLLDVSRLSTGKIKLQTRPISLATIIDHALEGAAPLIEAKGHQVLVSLPAPVEIVADAARIEQVLLNLLTNAAKYTDAGGRIAITGLREGNAAVLRVRDNGIGIDADLLEHVFEPFRQADHSLDRAEGGLGIGLTLVRKLVEMHGGSVTALSMGIGHGSEFIVRLPMPSAAGAPGAPGAPATAPRDDARPSDALTRLRVLVVEDATDTRDLLRLLLEQDGHEVEVGRSGSEAIEKATTFAPDVVLLDIGLPEMDGNAVARTLRERGYRGVLIATTGYGDDRSRERARVAGFDHYLVKPVWHEQLLALLVAIGGAPAP